MSITLVTLSPLFPAGHLGQFHRYIVAAGV